MEKLKTELVEQKQRMEQAESLQRQSQQEAPSHEQSKQQGHRHHSQGEEVLLLACRSGGAVESFVIAVKDREIRDLRKKVERQTVSRAVEKVPFFFFHHFSFQFS